MMDGLSGRAVTVLALRHAAADPVRNPDGLGVFAPPGSSAAEAQAARLELQGRGLLESSATSSAGGGGATTWRLTARGKRLAVAASPPAPPAIDASSPRGG